LSSTIIFTLIAIATQSFLPLLLALCCLGYLFFSARTSVDITTPNSKHYPETIADTENADKTNPQSKKEITLKKKDYRFSELSWIAYSEGIHSKDIAKHYDYEDLSIDDQDVTLLYEGAVYHVPIKNIKNWERWGNPTSQKESNLSEKSIEKVYRWQRIGEFDLIDLSNSKIEFKSVTPVVRFEYEGMLVVNTKGEETFIDAREIQNYWDF
jgi:hypothetical protein